MNSRLLRRRLPRQQRVHYQAARILEMVARDPLGGGAIATRQGIDQGAMVGTHRLHPVEHEGQQVHGALALFEQRGHDAGQAIIAGRARDLLALARSGDDQALA